MKNEAQTYEYNGYEIASRILKVSLIMALSFAVAQISMIIAIYG